ncbi:MAG: hypothetical protein ACUVV6_06855 [Thermoplasmatota archaeon]
MAGEDELSYNRLIHVYQQERRGGPPVQLQADFYDRVREYIDGLRRAYEEERSSDPTSMRALQLADQLQKARALRLDIVNLRLRKLLLLAHQALTGGPVDTRTATPEELSLFNSVLAALRETRRGALAEGSPGSPAEPSPAPAPAPSGPSSTQPAERAPPPARPAGERGGAPSAPPARARTASPGVEPAAPSTEGGGLVLLTVLEDIPEFAFGDSGAWSLRSKDLVALPPEVASVLERHGKARALK